MKAYILKKKELKALLKTRDALLELIKHKTLLNHCVELGVVTLASPMESFVEDADSGAHDCLTERQRAVLYEGAKVQDEMMGSGNIQMDYEKAVTKLVKSVMDTVSRINALVELDALSDTMNDVADEYEGLFGAVTVMCEDCGECTVPCEADDGDCNDGYPYTGTDCEDCDSDSCPFDLDTCPECGE